MASNLKVLRDRIYSIVLSVILIIILLNLVAFNSKVPLPIVGNISLNYILLTCLFIALLIKTIYNFKLSNSVIIYIYYFIFYVIYSTIIYLMFGENDTIDRMPLYINSFLILTLLPVIYNYLITKTINQFYNVLFWIAIVLGIGNLITMYQYFFQLNWNGFDSEEELILRAYGLYLNPNIAGFYATVSIIFSFHLLLFYNKYKTYNFLILIISLIAGLLTFSKTFFLNSFIILLMYIFYRRKYLKKYYLPLLLSRLKYLVLLPLVVFSYYVVNNDEILDKEQIARLETVFFFLNDSEIDYSGRSELADYGLQKVKNNPIIGYGYGTFTVLKDSNKLFDFTSSDLGVHNTFIRIWGEGGLASLLLYLIFWLYLLWKVYTNNSLEVKILSYMLIFTLNVYSFTSHNIPEDYFSAVIVVFVCYLLTLKYTSLSNDLSH